MDAEVEKGASSVVRSATFAVFIILIVFFPILTLTGIEGKYFTPMAKTLVFCIIGALFLSLTYVPMMASLFLKHHIVTKPTFADKFFEALNKLYARALSFCLRFKWQTVATAFVALVISLFLFTRLGAESVSYTHLDVYKRQSPSNMSAMSRLKPWRTTTRITT